MIAAPPQERLLHLPRSPPQPPRTNSFRGVPSEAGKTLRPIHSKKQLFLPPFLHAPNSITTPLKSCTTNPPPAQTLIPTTSLPPPRHAKHPLLKYQHGRENPPAFPSTTPIAPPSNPKQNALLPVR
ncbi:hypothetical protein M758_12G013100 [Ceratodon purpureus]|uniref:Uncharacterized protein n=1 Tax=Ceratodon purpureus TaxID=3225 RepID=A0A8T0G3F5_CERPU|nr:hypothetical protein KC19_12G012300 [Ceratodon purpureus]KAG0597674.1 hypothetical protein M758_12G013100 [Ceratodon purpureus]